MTALGLAVAGLAGLGGALVTLAVLGAVAALGRAAARWRTPAWMRYLRPAPVLKEATEAARRPGLRPLLPWLAGGVLLALLARDPILSPWMLALGAGLGWWHRGFAARQAAARATVPQTLDLVRNLSGFLRGAVGPALSDAAERLPEGPVRERALRAYRAYATGEPWETAVKALVGLNPLLDRLALVLAAAPRMDEKDVRDSLDALAEEAARREALAAETGAEMILLKLTVRFLMVANLVALAAVLLVPGWHDFFTSTLARRGTVMAANVLVAVSFVYFSEEIAALQETACET